MTFRFVRPTVSIVVVDALRPVMKSATIPVKPICVLPILS